MISSPTLFFFVTHLACCSLSPAQASADLFIESKICLRNFVVFSIIDALCWCWCTLFGNDRTSIKHNYVEHGPEHGTHYSWWNTKNWRTQSNTLSHIVRTAPCRSRTHQATRSISSPSMICRYWNGIVLLAQRGEIRCVFGAWAREAMRCDPAIHTTIAW